MTNDTYKKMCESKLKKEIEADDELEFQIVGYTGELYFNADKPDGTMKKLTDVSKLHALGWKHEVELENGIKKIYEWHKRDD
jgi:GDP-L-fucose synthase